MKRFVALDSFRGFCAVFVIFYHLHISDTPTEWAFFRNSDVFVDFFFVLSGFVITHSLIKNDKPFLSFFRARLLRIYPLHIFMLIIYIVLEFFKYLAGEYGGISFNVAAFSEGTALSQIIPNALLIHSWSSMFENMSFNFPSWSISIEFYMYVIFGLLFSLSRSNSMLYLLGLVLVILTVVFGSSNYTIYAQRGLLGFASGAVAYFIYNRCLRKTILKTSVMEVFSVVIIVIFVMSEFSDNKFLTATTFSFVVLLFSLEGGCVSRLLANKLPIMLGKLSYSIYMVHAAIIFIVLSILMVVSKVSGISYTPMLGGVRYIDFGNPIYNNLLLLFTILLVIVISSLTYQFIELYFAKIGNKKIKTGSVNYEKR